MRTELVESCDVCGGRRLVCFAGEKDLVCCKACGYVFHNPRPTVVEIAEFYAKPDKYAHWMEEETGRRLLWQNRLATVRRFRERGRLLDIGAGVGSFLELAKRYFDVCGTEVSLEAIRVARERAGVELVQGTMEELTLPEASFDVITMFHVLEHLHHPATTLMRCRRLLKPGGALIIAVPNDLEGLKFRVKRLAARAGIGHGPRWFGTIDLDPATTNEVHLSHFTARVLRRLLVRCGFRSVSDTLDRYYASTRLRRLADDVYFAACSGARTFGLRLYDTILISAEAPPSLRKAI